MRIQNRHVKNPSSWSPLKDFKRGLGPNKYPCDLRCIWGWFLRAPHPKGTTIFPMRQEFGMLEYHYELPNLSPRRYQLQVPVNYVSHWALVVLNGPGLPGSHECHLGIYFGGWLLKRGLFQSKTEMSSKGSRYSSSIMMYLCVQSVVDTWVLIWACLSLCLT